MTKKDSWVEMELLENCIREDLDEHAPRAMGVLRPLKLVLVDYPADRTEEFEVPRHPRDPSLGTRTVPFAVTVYIERDADQAHHSLTLTTTALPAMSAGIAGPRMFCIG